MIKFFNKKMVFSVVLILLSIFAGVAVIAGEITGIFGGISKKKLEIDNGKIVGFFDEISKDKTQYELEKTEELNNLIEYMDKNIGDIETYNNILFNLQYIKKIYKVSQENIDYISSLISNGYDPYITLDLAYFWLDTNEDIEIINKMYGYKEYFEGKSSWYDDAFNRVTGFDREDISEDEYKNYIKNGVAEEDFKIVEKLARKGKYTTKEMLNRIVEGDKLSDIAAELELSFDNNILTNIKSRIGGIFMKNGLDAKDILNRKRLAILTGTAESFYSNKTETAVEDEINKAEETAVNEIVSFLKNNNLMKTPGMTDDEKENDKELLKQIREAGLNESEIEQLLSKKCSYVEIFNIAEYKKEKNISLEKAYEEVVSE